MSMPQGTSFTPGRPDHILVAGGGSQALELLRLATIRSDDVTILADHLDPATRRYASQFAVDWQERPPTADDLGDVHALLIGLDDPEGSNRLVRLARRAGVPVHVSGRPLVSDFDLLAFVERRPSASAPAASALPL